jgi:hypothetical protein
LANAVIAASRLAAAVCRASSALNCESVRTRMHSVSAGPAETAEAARGGYSISLAFRAASLDLFTCGRLAVGHAARDHGRASRDNFPVPAAITARHNPELDILGHATPAEFDLWAVSECCPLHRIRSTGRRPNRARVQRARFPPLSPCRSRTAYTVLDSSTSLSCPLS